MSINDISPQSIARHRQEVDPKRRELKSSHAAARKINDDTRCAKELAAMENETDADYLNELFKDEDD